MSDLLTRDVLVINQKPKFVEMTNEYRILDEKGNDIGVIRQEAIEGQEGVPVADQC